MLRVLRDGATGEDVKQWQQFLVGQGLLHEAANGVYDDATKQATIDFQRSHPPIDVDGWVGGQTMGVALQLGYGIMVTDDPSAEDGPGWPVKPDFHPLTGNERENIFGKFGYAAAPTATCAEAIRFTNNWPSTNITTVEIPQLTSVQGAPHKVQFHTKAADQLLGLFQAWDDAGLMPLVKSWAGSWAPRFIRGSRVYLSNHAWGTAFDINAAWNGLGMQPALKGKIGSVRELVSLANEWGFYWGGHFPGRLDGMHFEVAFIR